MLEFRLPVRDELVVDLAPLRSATKRAVDVIGATILLILLAPLLLVVAIVLKIESPGPVLFRQARMGSRPRRIDDTIEWCPMPFRVFKFRSMVDGADAEVHADHVRRFVAGAVAGNGDSRARYKLDDDERVTRFGRFIRRWSIDEVPQLLNVVLGDMSLVGPRPVPLYEAALYKDEHLGRLQARPGLTGLWQVMGRCDVGFEDMIRLDLEYIRRQSLALDLKILAYTIPAVLNGRGAG